MQEGMLWFDSDGSRSLAAKIEDAARRYREKFGRQPDTCYVNSATLAGAASGCNLFACALRIVACRQHSAAPFLGGRRATGRASTQPA